MSRRSRTAARTAMLIVLLVGATARAESSPPEPSRAWHLRGRLGGGYFSSSHWSFYEGDDTQTVFGGAGAVEVAAGLRPTDWLVTSLSGAFCLGPAPGYDPRREPPGESRTFTWILVGPNAMFFIERLRLDATFGVVRLDHDVDEYFDGDPSQHHLLRVGTWGLGYAVGLAFAAPVSAWSIGPYLQWRATSVGDILVGGEEAAGWKTTMLGGGFQVGY